MLHECCPGWGPDCVDLLLSETGACTQRSGALVTPCLRQQLQPLARKQLSQLAVKLITAAELIEPGEGCYCMS